jgi:hypothetical protein
MAIDFELLGRAFFDWAMAQGVFAEVGDTAKVREAFKTQPQFFTIPELAERWRIARPTVYGRLQKLGIKVLDLSPGTARGRKVVPRSAVLEAESRQLKRF